MNYLQLGQSALQISSIGFGCMSLKDEQSAARLIHRAIEAGINFFDTADLYDKGMNEEWVKWFPVNPPARQGAKLPVRIPGMRVSIAAIAEA